MGKRTDLANRFAAERNKSSAMPTESPVKEENLPSKTTKIVQKKRIPKTKPGKPASETRSDKENADALRNTSISEPGNKSSDTVENQLHKPAIKESSSTVSMEEQLETLMIQNRSKVPIVHTSFSLESNVLEGMKKTAKDKYGIPLSQLVNIIFKDFLDKNAIQY